MDQLENAGTQSEIKKENEPGIIAKFFGCALLLSFVLMILDWVGLYDPSSSQNESPSIGAEADMMASCTERAKSQLTYPDESSFPTFGIQRSDLTKVREGLYNYVLVREVEAVNAFGVGATRTFYCEATLRNTGSDWRYSINEAYFYPN